MWSVKPPARTGTLMGDLTRFVPKTQACPRASTTDTEAKNAADMQAFFASKPWAVHTADGQYVNLLKTACLYALLHIPRESIRVQVAAACGIDKDSYDTSRAMFESAPEPLEEKKNALLALFAVWRLTPYNTQRPRQDATFKLDYQWCPSDTYDDTDSTSLFASFQQDLVQHVMRLHPSSDVGGHLKHDSVLLYFYCVCLRALFPDLLDDSYFAYLRVHDAVTSFMDDHDGKTVIQHEVEDVIAARDPDLANLDYTDAARIKLHSRTGDSLESLFRRMCFKKGMPDMVTSGTAAAAAAATAAAEQPSPAVTSEAGTAQGVGDNGPPGDVDVDEEARFAMSAISSGGLCHYHHYGDTTVPLCNSACLETRYGAAKPTESSVRIGAALIGRDRLKHHFGVQATPAHVPKNIKDWIGLANAVRAPPATKPLGYLEGIDDLARGTSWQGADANTKTRNYILAMSGHPLDAIWRENGWGAPQKADEEKVRAYRATTRTPSLRTAQLLMHFAGRE